MLASPQTHAPGVVSTGRVENSCEKRPKRRRVELEIDLHAELYDPRRHRIGRPQPGCPVAADRSERRRRVAEVVDVEARVEFDLADLKPPAEPNVELVEPRLIP